MRKELKQALLYSGQKLTTRKIDLMDGSELVVGAVYLVFAKDGAKGLGPLRHGDIFYYIETDHAGDIYEPMWDEVWVIEMVDPED